MKKNKGFTLVELLAVIVILAIIAVIVVPIILNVIEDSKKGAAKAGALGYLDAVEKQIVLDQTNNKSNWNAGTYNVSDVNVKVKGTGPTGGTFTLNNKNQLENMDICIMNYWVQYKDKKAVVKGDCSEIDFNAPTITLNDSPIISGTSAKFNYSVNDESSYTVKCYYGETDNYEFSVDGTDVECSITGLSTGKTYYYKIVVTDKYDNESYLVGSFNMPIGNLVIDNNSNGEADVGDKYSLDPGDGTIRDFYVLQVTDDDIYFLLDGNIGSSTWSSQNNGNPDVIMNYLNSNTSGWVNGKVSLPTYSQLYNVSNSTSTPAWLCDGQSNYWTGTAYSTSVPYHVQNVTTWCKIDIYYSATLSSLSVRPVIQISKSKL